MQQNDSNQVLSNFLIYCESETIQFKELLQLTKVNKKFFLLLIK